MNPIPIYALYSPISHLRRCQIDDELGNCAKRTTEFTIQRASMDFVVGYIRGFFRDVLDFATNFELFASSQNTEQSGTASLLQNTPELQSLCWTCVTKYFKRHDMRLALSSRKRESRILWKTDDTGLHLFILCTFWNNLREKLE